jgi:hypothetical protein
MQSGALHCAFWDWAPRLREDLKEYADNSVEFLESSGISGRTGANVYSAQEGVLIFSMCAAATQGRTGNRTGPQNVPHRSSAQVSAQLRGGNS